MSLCPIDPYLSRIQELLRDDGVLILTASPGSGKTTRVPPALLSLTEKKIAVLEPRRVAAVMACHRIAQEQGWTVGEEVGYQVRFENKTQARTRLHFLTEALLLKKMIANPALDEFGLIILDEFHERSIHVDTAMALLQELRTLGREDLKILVMSATLNVEKVRSFWPGSAELDVQNPPHPLVIDKDKRAQLIRTTPEWYERLSEAVATAFQRSPGQRDVLVFLPGAGEIDRARDSLSPLAARLGFFVERMHAQLPLAEQRRVLQSQSGHRRVILATNVCESSITIDGVDAVVDCGLEKINQIHPRTGFESLDLVRISAASARQRAGRAARQGPGYVYQMWSTHDELSMSAERPAEITRVDLTDWVLLLASLRVRDPLTVDWFEKPPPHRVVEAQKLCGALGALDAEGHLTDKGVAMVNLPLAARWASLCVEAQQRGLAQTGLQLSALIQGSVPQAKGNFADLWAEYCDNPARFPASQRILQQLEWAAKSQVGAFGTSAVPRARMGRSGFASFASDRPPHRSEVSALLFQAFPDRLCRLRQRGDPTTMMVGGRGSRALAAGERGSRALMVGGRGLRFSAEVPTAPTWTQTPSGPWEFFLALDLLEGRSSSESLVTLYYPLEKDFMDQQIRPLAQERQHTVFDEGLEKFFSEKTVEYICMGGGAGTGLPLEEGRRSPASPADVEGAMTDYIVDNWDDLKERWPGVKDWISRYEYWRKNRPGSPPSEASEPSELEHVRQFAQMICPGETSIRALEGKDFSYFLALAFVAEAERTVFERECPSQIISPRGKHLTIHYPANSPPRIEIRIQDAFGWSETPKIMGEPLMIDLLAPNGRPTQRTRDLRSFWKNSYKEIRKELRARYPKHAWPEDPTKFK
ncbi:MAG: hypothetical protein C5B49_14845 [Bdellovibrio sp.]|nr:MAG: hypothetical protein C5B49_14845 [Bdellovibrio sp.]